MELFNLSFFSITDQGIDFDYCDIEWFAFEMSINCPVVFETARVNIDILGISELKWVNFTQMTIISTTVGRNPLEEME